MEYGCPLVRRVLNRSSPRRSRQSRMVGAGKVRLQPSSAAAKKAHPKRHTAWSARAHFPGFGVARQGPWNTWVNIIPPPCPELDPYHLLRALERISRWLIGQWITTVGKPAQCVPATDRIERLSYGFHQSLLRAGLEAA